MPVVPPLRASVAPVGTAPPPGTPSIAQGTDPGVDRLWAVLRGLALFKDASNQVLRTLIDTRAVALVDIPRDIVVRPPDGADPGLCLVASGQVALGVFDAAALAERLAHRQRDAARGEDDGTLLPPVPLARLARKNLALFAEGELFNFGALVAGDGGDVVTAFSLRETVAITIAPAAIERLARDAQPVEAAVAAALQLTAARLRAVTGVKHELLDFYLRNGLSVAGPTVRVRQLDLCIDCKQCEDACEERHGARRLTLGGFELGLVDVVFSCRTCADARCLSPCEHDAIKRDAATGEVLIHEDKCIGCSLCALSCPYGAIDMVNVAEPDQPTYKPLFKARLDEGGRLAFGAGKGRSAPARRIANKCDHCNGYQEQACVSACPTGSLIEVSPAVLFRERPAPGDARKRLEVLPLDAFVAGVGVKDSGQARVQARRLGLIVWMLGMGAFLAVLAEIGLRWYAPTWSVSFRLLRLEGVEPDVAVLNVSYLAGSKMALTCGYLGTALMVLSMAYPLQRRFGWWHRTASNQFWLEVHLMTGLVGPLFIVLHSALRLTTWVSVPFWCMVAVVVSGVLGRYLYTLVPSLTSRHDLDVLAHRRAITEVASLHPEAAARAQAIVDREGERSNRSWEIGLVPLLLWIAIDDLRRSWARGANRRALRRHAPRKVARALARHVDRVVFFERRGQLAPRGKALLRSWKRVHVPFSVVLLVTMIAHIVIALGLATV